MDCKTARLLLDFARPLTAELEESEGEALAGHLADCPRCGALHRDDRRIDDHIGLAVRAVAVPDGLRDRLLTRLATQRDAWYRRRFLTWGATAAAAAVFLWAGLAWLNRPSAVDLARVSEAVNHRDLPESADQVGAWFGRADLRGPSEFNYRQLEDGKWGEFQGRRVPVLIFRNGSATAWVYLLDGRQFDLASLKGQSPISGRHSFTVLWPSDGQHTAYVVEYTGGRLEPFLAFSQAT